MQHNTRPFRCFLCTLKELDMLVQEHIRNCSMHFNLKVSIMRQRASGMSPRQRTIKSLP